LEAGAVATEVFIVGILLGSFCPTDDSSKFVGPAGSAVLSSEPGCADVRDPSVVAEDGVLRAVSGGIQTSDQARIVHKGRLAKRVAHGAEVGDGITGNPSPGGYALSCSRRRRKNNPVDAASDPPLTCGGLQPVIAGHSSLKPLLRSSLAV